MAHNHGNTVPCALHHYRFPHREYDGCHIPAAFDGAYIKSDSVSFLDPASVNTPEPTADIWPQIDQDEFLDDWRYKLVNSDNLLVLGLRA